MILNERSAKDEAAHGLDTAHSALAKRAGAEWTGEVERATGAQADGAEGAGGLHGRILTASGVVGKESQAYREGHLSHQVERSVVISARTRRSAGSGVGGAGVSESVVGVKGPGGDPVYLQFVRDAQASQTPLLAPALVPAPAAEISIALAEGYQAQSESEVESEAVPVVSTAQRAFPRGGRMPLEPAPQYPADSQRVVRSRVLRGRPGGSTTIIIPAPLPMPLPAPPQAFRLPIMHAVQGYGLAMEMDYDQFDDYDDMDFSSSGTRPLRSSSGPRSRSFEDGPRYFKCPQIDCDKLFHRKYGLCSVVV